MLKLSGLACGFVLTAAGLARAQVETTTTTTTTPAGATEVRRVSQLIGSNVALQGNDNFGKIEDIVLNENGAPGYMVVSNGGQYAMLPFGAANINYGRRTVSYNVTPQVVQPLFFAPTAWPNMTNQQFTTRINKAFPGTGIVRQEVMRPVEGALPVGGPAVVKEKVKVKNNGDVKIKEKVR